MSKIIKKKIKIPVDIKDQGIAEMFNQMLGAGSVNLQIAYPRYLRIKGIIKSLLTVFKMFNESPFMKHYGPDESNAPLSLDLKQSRKEIRVFCNAVEAAINELFAVDLSKYEWNLNLVEEPLKQQFTEAYEKAKKSDIVNAFVIMCDRLIKHKNYIGGEDHTKLSYTFILTSAGVSITPFPFSQFNLKDVFVLKEISETTKRFILTVLNKALTLSHSLYKEITTPDINVDEFVEVIKANLSEVRKIPGLHRCQDAFDKIEESIFLLKDNFGGYYRDFIGTNGENPTIIMEHFIIDVSKNTNADAKTTMQFRRIIQHYKKMAQEHVSTNPKIKMLFDKMNDNFKELERHTENLSTVRNTDMDDADDEHEDSDSEENPIEHVDNPDKKSVDQLVAEIESAGKKKKSAKK